MNRARVAAVVAAAACLLPALVPLAAWAAPAAGSAPARAPRVTFGIGPASTGKAQERPEFSFGATQRAVLSDRAQVLNFSAVPLRLQIYATDAVPTANGGFGLRAPGAALTDLGSWIHVPAAAETIVVPAVRGTHPGRVLIPFSLRVPTDAAPGDHFGAIVASLTTEGRNATGQTVILHQRVGTRVAVRVAGALRPQLSVTDLHATYHGRWNPVGRGDAVVSFVVHNTGNVGLGFQQSVELSGLFGWGSTQRAAASAPTTLLLPGGSVRESVRFSAVWPQVLGKAQVSVRALAPTGNLDPRLPVVTATAHLWEVPWTLLALIALVLVAVSVVVWLRRRSRQAPVAPKPEAVKVGAE